jgi:AsmA protein
MKRVALLAVIVVALVAAAVVAIPNVLSADLIKQRIAENIAAATGRQVVLKGKPVLTIYPSLAISVADLTIANPDGTSGDPFLTSENVTARVRLLPLLLGNAQFDSIQLTKPRIHLVQSTDGRTNWAIAAATGTPSGAVASPPRRIRISSGTVIYDDIAAARHEELSELELDAAWTGPGSPLTGSGAARWRGEPVEFNLQIGDPIAAATGSQSPFRLALVAKPVRIAFNGTVGPGVEGTVSVSTPALRRLIEWTGRPMGNGSTLGAASVQGKIDWVGRRMSFADATLELDGNSAVGAFTVDYGAARLALAGTLAASRIDFSPYVEGIHGDATTLLGPATLPLADVFDADLRLSSDQVLIGPLRITKAAGAVAMKAGNFSLNIGAASLYGGTLTADASVTKFGDRLVSQASATLANVAARPALIDLAGIQSLEGSAGGSLDVRGQGSTWGEFVQSLAAHGSFAVSNGTLSGLDIAQLAALTDASAAPIVPGAGFMAFTKLSGTANLDGGILETKDTVLAGSTYRIDLKGWGSLASGLIDASAVLLPATGAAAAKVVPIAVTGTWRRPHFDLDRGRSSPSPAAAPRG